jgi:hypothetical protein
MIRAIESSESGPDGRVVVQLVLARGEHGEERPVSIHMGDVVERRRARLVTPLQVVEDEHDRALPRLTLHELGQTPEELIAIVAMALTEDVRRSLGSQPAQRVDPEREGTDRLGLEGAGLQEIAPRAGCELGGDLEQATLADSGLALKQQESRTAEIDGLLEPRLQPFRLFLAPHEKIRRLRDAESTRTRADTRSSRRPGLRRLVSGVGEQPLRAGTDLLQHPCAHAVLLLGLVVATRAHEQPDQVCTHGLVIG